ncbi:hypothetical protein ADK35_02000 [Streptomyces viridochromogenes]|uniref:hypothetical protein n=1 Tax=Streptomyces viridochromogenes TaxID=1938 RepID=UPI00069F3595|nr:hypothetical protein [Streptomyces viridochromogenes]KOG29490.1 hypothetical protein ADK35_02000 [Streptomyces viridochromogenes]
MTDHTGRAGLEKDELYALALEFEHLRTEVVRSYTHSTLPDLATASHHLGALTGLVKDLSDEVLFRATDQDPGLDFGLVIAAYTSASAPAGRAMNNYTEAFEQLGFLRRYAEDPASANLRDARQSAFDVTQDRLDLTVDSLQETFVELRRAADRIDGTPPRVLAALSRSARPTNSIYRLPVEPPAPGPVRLAYTPAPRHGR